MYRLLILALFSYCSEASRRIVGGRVISISTVPYQLSLRRSGHHICGASLISPKIGISAAHCVAMQAPYSIRAGSNSSFVGGIIRHVDLALVHPKFDMNEADYDISILFWKELVPLSSAVQPVKLPKEGVQIKEGSIGIVSGWGLVSSNTLNIVSKELRSVELPIWNWQKCKQVYYNQVTDRDFCAGLERGGKDACQGDSGGPFVVNKVLMGIVSSGLDCAQPNYPGIYTSVPVLRGFIKEYAGL